MDKCRNEKDDSGAGGLGALMFDEELIRLNRRIHAVADVKGNILREECP